MVLGPAALNQTFDLVDKTKTVAEVRKIYFGATGQHKLPLKHLHSAVDEDVSNSLGS